MALEIITLLDKQYDGESICDVGRDVREAFDGTFTPQLSEIPQDEYGFHKGFFVVTVKWHPEET